MGMAAILGWSAVQLQTVHAQQQDWSQFSTQWIEGALSQQPQTQNLPLRMEVQVGRLDARLNLAPCHRVEPYVPNGSRLWGRSRIGLRCVEGPKPWNVFLPVTIKAWGPAWVMTHNVNMGDELQAQSAMQSEVDWAAESSPIIALPEDWVGQTAARPLMAGQALRQSMVRPAQILKTGASVKVLVRGGGFMASSIGKVTTGAGVGQNVRVRMDNGSFVTGVVNAEGEVVVSQ